MLDIINKIRMAFIGRQGFAHIKTYADRCARQMDHEAYERVLSAYDAALSFRRGALESDFVGSGKGRYTLNSYRKIVLQDSVLFEKIYLRDSVDWRKCNFFYKHVLSALSGDELSVPRLLDVVSGERLVVSRFEFVDFRAIDESDYIDRLVSVTRRLASFEYDSTLVLGEFKSLELHFGFERCLRKTQAVLEQIGEKNSVLLKMKERCEAMPRFVGHGDLSLPNMGVGSIVLDWDNFGFYPPGFDLALGSVLKGELLNAEALNSMVERVFPSFSTRCTFDMLWFSFVFFYCVFLSARQAEHKHYVYTLLVKRFS